MENLRRLALGLLFGVVVGLVVAVGPAEATIAKEVPLGSGDFSVAEEGYVKIGKHFTKGHVDMNISSVRLCGHFPFYYPCVDIDYWVPNSTLYEFGQVSACNRPIASSPADRPEGFLPTRYRALMLKNTRPSTGAAVPLPKRR